MRAGTNSRAGYAGDLFRRERLRIGKPSNRARGRGLMRQVEQFSKKAVRLKFSFKGRPIMERVWAEFA